MNMLRDERNADYRHLIRSTLEFDPRILKRYVNFMSNPDERTALDQFGKDGKYFGVATLMATLPGLPMLGHGQVEGLAEKYGMEFYRARWSEQPDEGLVRRHERQLFPLLRRRRAFAEVERFQLYDLVCQDGSVDENVFAYSNGSGAECSLVLFHNRFAETSGWIRRSCAVQTNPAAAPTRCVTHARGGPRAARRRQLVRGAHRRGERPRVPALVPAAPRARPVRGARRLRAARVHRPPLSGRPGRSPLCQARRAARRARRAERRRSAGRARARAGPRAVPAAGGAGAPPRAAGPPARRAEEPSAGGLLDRVEAALEELLAAIQDRIGGEPVPELARAIRADLEELLTGDRRIAASGLVPPAAGSSPLLPAALAWVLLRRLADGAPEATGDGDVGRWLDGWFLLSNLRHSLVAIGLGAAASERAVAAVRTLDACRGWWRADEAEEPLDLEERMGDLLAEPAVAAFLGINRYDEVEWFVAEAWDELQLCLAVVAAVETDDPDVLAEVGRHLDRLELARQASGYQVDALIAALAADPE